MRKSTAQEELERQVAVCHQEALLLLMVLQWNQHDLEQDHGSDSKYVLVINGN